jgi:hypothetical protein
MSKKFNVHFSTIRELIEHENIEVINKNLMEHTTYPPYTKPYSYNIYKYTPPDGSPVKIFNVPNQYGNELLCIHYKDSLNIDCYLIIYIGNNPSYEFSEEFKKNISNEILKGNGYNLYKFGVMLIPILKIYDESSFLNIDNAKILLNQLNEELNCLNYNLTLEYLHENTEDKIIHVHSIPDLQDLVLCIYKGNRCVSSIEMVLDEDNIVISSHTEHSESGKNLNKLLRAVSIIIGKSINPLICDIYSYAINPISAYLLIKYFGAETELNSKLPRDLTRIKLNDITRLMNDKNKDDHDDDDDDDDEVEAHDDDDEGLHCTIPLDEYHVELARNVFRNIVETIDCERGPARSVGGKTKKRKTKRKTKRNRKSKRRIKN